MRTPGAAPGEVAVGHDIGEEAGVVVGDVLLVRGPRDRASHTRAGRRVREVKNRSCRDVFIQIWAMDDGLLGLFMASARLSQPGTLLLHCCSGPFVPNCRFRRGRRGRRC